MQGTSRALTESANDNDVRDSGNQNSDSSGLEHEVEAEEEHVQLGSEETRSAATSEQDSHLSSEGTNIAQRWKGLARFRAAGVLNESDTQKLAAEDWRWRKGLLPAATYAVQVQAHNDRGWGKFCQELHIRTSDDIPDAPEDIGPKVALATELEMTFTAPRANCTPNVIECYETERKVCGY